ncbi:unnamed protein product [Paramecium sonneborni]|uniref:OTU domain-containing protein n=1 Tax=Paramecium sonneborni TaxID=65129 RepID=A0A8S1MNY2_9CILI|nr:unnamed protein product [Paramecium sonneborni]
MSQKCKHYMQETKSSKAKSEANKEKFAKLHNQKFNKSSSKPKSLPKKQAFSSQTYYKQNSQKQNKQNQPQKRENYHQEQFKIKKKAQSQHNRKLQSPEIGKNIQNNKKNFQFQQQQQYSLEKPVVQKNPQIQNWQKSSSPIIKNQQNNFQKIQNKNLQTPQKQALKSDQKYQNQQLTNKFQNLDNKKKNFNDTLKKQQINYEEQIDNKEKINESLNFKQHYPQNDQIIFDQQRLNITIENVKKLVQISSEQRYVEENQKFYLQQYGDQNTLYSNYGIKQLKIRCELKIHCNEMLFVRGDGNCFYTAFGFQFLKLLLITYSDAEFNEFLNFIKQNQIKFKIYCKNFKIDDENIEKLLMEQFIYVLQQIRKIESKEERVMELKKQYQEYQISNNGDGCFYCLSTIFFRNLSDRLLDNSELKDQVYDRINLLTWETECNNNEIIISILAQYLKIYVKLIFFHKGSFNLIEYEKDQPNKIVLLIQPGHYNIGLKN